jgi:hypothetical protein
MDLKQRIDELRTQIHAIELEIKQLQEQCPHPEFEQGWSMVGCVAAVLFCTTCGEMKPMPYNSDLDEPETYYTDSHI